MAILLNLVKKDGRRNGVGVILKEYYIGRVLEVKRVSDIMMYMKLDIEGVTITDKTGFGW